MYGVENRVKMQLLLRLKESPLRHAIPATKHHLTLQSAVFPPPQQPESELMIETNRKLRLLVHDLRIRVEV